MSKNINISINADYRVIGLFKLSYYFLKMAVSEIIRRFKGKPKGKPEDLHFNLIIGAKVVKK